MPHQLRLLGGLRLDRDDQPVAGRGAHRRRLALLALLSATPGKRLTRERVMAYLWPDVAAEAARRSLSESLYALRQELGDSAIVSNGEELNLDALIVPSDLDAIEAAAAKGEFRSVVAGYVGPFLDGWFVEDAAPFEQWSELQRDRVHKLVVRAAVQEAEACASRNDVHACVDAWRAAARLEPNSSAHACQLALALVSCGERAEALRVLGAHRDRVREDFEIEPDETVDRLESQLRAESASRADVSGGRRLREASDERSRSDEPSLGFTSSFDARGPSPSPAQTAAPRSRVPFYVGLACALVLVVFFAWNSNRRAGPANSSPTSGPIAILMFEHGRADSGLKYLAEDLTTGIIDQLSVNTFRVLPIAEVRAIKQGAASTDSVFASRQVGIAVEGTLTSSDGQLRASMRLLDAKTRAPLAAATFNRPIGDVFVLESDLVQFIAGALRQQYRQDIIVRDAESGNLDATAHKLVLTALRRRDDALTVMASRKKLDIEAANEMLFSADTLLQRAVPLAPRWTRPVITRGHIFRDRARMLAGAVRAATLDSAMTFANSAIALDAHDAAALELRGVIRWSTAMSQINGGRDTISLAMADKDLKAALDIESSRATTWLALSLVQTARGQAHAALVSARRAREENTYIADPFDTYFAEFASAMVAGQLDEADRWCATGRSAFPHESRFLECALTVLRDRPGAPQHVTAAWNYVAQLDTIDLHTPRRGNQEYAPTFRRLLAAAITAKAGDTVRARAELIAARRRVEGNHSLQIDLAFDEAYIRLLLGERATAIRLLRELMKERPANVRIIESAPLFEPIRSSVFSARLTN